MGLACGASSGSSARWIRKKNENRESTWIRACSTCLFLSILSSPRKDDRVSIASRLSVVMSSPNSSIIRMKASDDENTSVLSIGCTNRMCVASVLNSFASWKVSRSKHSPRVM